MEFIKQEDEFFGEEAQCDSVSKSMEEIYVMKKEREENNTESKSRKSAESINCPICNKILKNKWSLKAHEGSHSKPFSCTECGLRCSTKAYLKKHTTTHNGVMIACSHCDKTFLTKEYLKRHELIVHNEDKPFSCTICGFKCKQKHNLKLHMTNHTGEKERTFVCNVCRNQYTNKANLNRHMTELHRGENAFSCTMCDESFMSSYLLRKHMLIHQTKHLCNICNKGFISKSKLDTHIAIHTKEKPFCCTVCGKCFTQKGNLNQHMVFHTGEKAYACTLCNKSYHLKSGLTDHMISHVDEKAFSCNICCKPFKTRYHVKKHMLRLHSGETETEEIDEEIMSDGNYEVSPNKDIYAHSIFTD